MELALFLFLLAAIALPSAAQGIYGFPIAVRNHSAHDRVGAPVAFGVSGIYPGLFADPNATIQLVDDQGNLCPVQFKVLARWHGTRDDWGKGIKWMLVEFPADVPAGSFRVYSLRAGARQHGLITVQETANETRISTGPAEFALSKTGFSFLNEVKIGTQTITGGPGALEVRDVAGNVASITILTSEIEEGGDVRTVVKQTGRINGIELHFTVRWFFFTGSKDVRVEFRLENRGQYGELPNLGTQIEHAHFEDLRLVVNLADQQSSVVTTQNYRTTVGAPWSLNQGFGAPSSPLQMLSGFAFDESWNGQTIASGNRYEGACALNGSSGSVAVSIDRFWQNFPKAFSTQSGALAVHLWPAFGSGPHYTGQYGTPTGNVVDSLSQNFYRFEGGRWKTHTIDLSFSTGAFTPTDLLLMAEATNTPLQGMTPPDWPFRCLAFGTLAMERRNWSQTSFQRFEKMMDVLAHDSAADPQPVLGQIGFPEFRNRGGTYGGGQFFGWENFGDIVWGDGYSSLHYDMPFGVLLNWYRTADYAFFDIARDMVAHRRDYDQFHTESTNAPRRGGQAYEKGWFHGNYDQPQPSHTWVQGLLLWYVTTGDESAREAAIETFGFIQRNHPESWDGWWGSRIQGWQIEALVDLYNYVGDPQMLALAQQACQRFEFLEQQAGGFGYVPNPGWSGNPHEQTWMHGIVLSAIAKYYYASLDPGVLPLMTRMANWIMTDVVKTAPSGPDTNRTVGKVWGRAKAGWQSEPSLHHLWVTANALTWAALCIHNNAYMAMAGDLFEGVARYHQKDASDDTPEDYTDPSTFSPIAFRMMQYPGAESKIMSNIALWGQSYLMGRTLWDHAW